MPRKYLRCIEHVKDNNMERKTDYNPYAVCAKLKKGKGLRDLFLPRNKPTPEFLKQRRKYDDKIIDKLVVVRTPIHKAINLFFNAISLGKFEKAKKDLNYDNMFHLGLLIYLKNGQALTIEKNEVVTLSDQPHVNAQTQYLHVTKYSPNSLNVEMLINKTLRYMGEFDFYSYDAKTRNCQKFITSILQANNVFSRPLDDFVNQDAIGVFERLPGYAEKISRFLTDLGAKFSGGFLPVENPRTGMNRWIAW